MQPMPVRPLPENSLAVSGAKDRILMRLYELQRPELLGFLSTASEWSIEHTEMMLDELVNAGVVVKLSPSDNLAKGFSPRVSMYALREPSRVPVEVYSYWDGETIDGT